MRHGHIQLEFVVVKDSLESFVALELSCFLIVIVGLIANPTTTIISIVIAIVVIIATIIITIIITLITIATAIITTTAILIATTITFLLCVITSSKLIPSVTSKWSIRC